MSNAFPHSRRHRPPLPALKIMLRAVDGSRSRSELLPALLDTGADITSVPVRILHSIGALPLDEVRLRSHWGHAVSVVTYLVDVEVNEAVLPAIEVAGDTTNAEIVLGRDVLNQLLLLIDGPGLTTDVLEHRPRRSRRKEW
jgi:predicted aspartyl protease